MVFIEEVEMGCRCETVENLTRDAAATATNAGSATRGVRTAKSRN